MPYKCNTCKMEIKDIECNTCDEALVPGKVQKDGQSISVARCEKCEGKIKAPFCCGKDMQYS